MLANSCCALFPIKQDNLIMLAMKHMEGGCMRDVLRQPDAADALGWHNWCGRWRTCALMP